MIEFLDEYLQAILCISSFLISGILFGIAYYFDKPQRLD